MASGILIADPSPALCATLERACDQLGFSAKSVHTLASARSALACGSFRLLVCSLDWPAAPRGGIELLTAAQQANPDISMILLVARDAELGEPRPAWTGLFACLPKPIPSLDALTITLGAALWRPGSLLPVVTQVAQALAGATKATEMLDATACALLEGLSLDGVALNLTGPPDTPCESLTIRQMRANLDDARREQTVALLDSALGGMARQEETLAQAACDLAIGGRLGGALVGHASLARPTGEAQLLLEACLAVAAAALSFSARLAQARDLAQRDALTGLYNHAQFIAAVCSEIQRARVGGYPIAVVMLDVDSCHGLKEINDRYGHQAGDRLVVHLAHLLRDEARKGDTVARYGGDEFLILAPHVDASQARPLAQDLIDTLHAAALSITRDVQVHVTLSAGVAVFDPEAHEGVESLLERMDRALYAAKALGSAQVYLDG